MFTFKEESLCSKNTKVKSLFVITGKADINPATMNTKTYKTSDNKIVQGWLNFSCHNGYIDSLDIIPTQKLLKMVNDAMLKIEYDQIYFNAIPFEDGKFKLYVQYNQIIGSRFLGWFKLSELGDYAKRSQ